MFDPIILGARCGGSPTAMLMIDRARFPSDALLTVQQPAMHRVINLQPISLRTCGKERTRQYILTLSR